VRELQERRVIVAPLGLTGRRGLIPFAAVAVIIADQVTKTLALDHLDLYRPTHVVGPVYLALTYNSGAAFSLGTGVTPILEAVVVVLIVGLLIYSRRASRSGPMAASVALGMLLGGALSNLADRLFRHLPVHGSVVDFIRAVGWFPVFNVADSSIVIGVIILVLSWREMPERPNA
jgi:signal peptidase II